MASATRFCFRATQKHLTVERTRRSRAWAIMLKGLSLVWIMFAKLIVPSVIESAYRGESWPFLNRMILGQAESPVSHYLQKWDKVTITVLLSGLGFSLIALVISSPAFI